MDYVTKVVFGIVDSSELEVCGVITYDKGNLEVIEMQNLAQHRASSFALGPREFLSTITEHNVLAVFHSHVVGSSEPSEEDIESCNRTGIPFVIYSKATRGVSRVIPDGYQIESLEKPFILGLYDCLSVVINYYKMKFSKHIYPIEYPAHGWWKGKDDIMYINLAAQGFIRVDNMKTGDVILMNTEGTNRSNHMAIYYGDNQILHHINGRLSTVEPYSRFWRKMTLMTMRLPNES